DFEADPVCVELGEDQVRERLRQRLEQVEAVRGEHVLDGMDDRGVIDGVLEQVGVAGVHRVAADLDVELQRLRMPALVLVGADHRVEPEVADIDDVHGGGSGRRPASGRCDAGRHGEGPHAQSYLMYLNRWSSFGVPSSGPPSLPGCHWITSSIFFASAKSLSVTPFAVCVTSFTM